jgi:hypothetical protein
MSDAKAATRGGQVAAAQRLTGLGEYLLIGLSQQLPLMPAAFASPHDRPAGYGGESIIHDRDLLSWLPRQGV